MITAFNDINRLFVILIKIMTEKHLRVSLPQIPERVKLLLGGSLVGMTRVVAGFPLEHPIDAVKVQWQA